MFFSSPSLQHSPKVVDFKAELDKLVERSLKSGTRRHD